MRKIALRFAKTIEWVQFNDMNVFAMMNKNKNSSSAGRVLDLLEEMVQRSVPVSLAEIHRAMNLPKSSTLMLLRTLESRGYVDRVQTGAYRVIRLPGENSRLQPAWTTLVRIATPWLTEAVSTTQESGFLAVFSDDAHIRYLNKILPASRELKYDRNIQIDRCAHQVSSGLALLAAACAKRVERYLSQLPPTLEAADQAKTVRAAIEHARLSDVVVTLSDAVEGAAGVASVVRDRNGRALAAINLAGPVDRVATSLPALSRATRVAVDGIEQSLATHAQPAWSGVQQGVRA